jgi:hypothetical protein
VTKSPSDLDALIARARGADILAVAERTGAQLKQIRATDEWASGCPTCGGKDTFSVNTERKLFVCRRGTAGGDVIDLAQHALGLDFAGAIEFITGEEVAEASEVSDKPAKSPASDDERRARDLKSAKRIASEIRPLFSTDGERYLREKRCIDTTAVQDILARADAIGWHDAVYLNEPAHPLHGQRLGCIVGTMTDPVSARPTGAISRTYLAPDLTKIGKAKTLGSPVGIVRLSPDDEVQEGWFLVEGLETALAAMSIGLRPTWSTGSTSPMAKFPVLSGIEHLSIVCDHDPNGAGEDAAREVERRWRAAGRQVSILRSERNGDLNDMVRKDSQK